MFQKKRPRFERKIDLKSVGLCTFSEAGGVAFGCTRVRRRPFRDNGKILTGLVFVSVLTHNEALLESHGHFRFHTFTLAEKGQGHFRKKKKTQQNNNMPVECMSFVNVTYNVTTLHILFLILFHRPITCKFLARIYKFSAVFFFVFCFF